MFGTFPVSVFLYIDPLKQGLKPKNVLYMHICYIVFIHRSIKTRIETGHSDGKSPFGFLFLYIDPLKQGLKHIS